MTLTRTASTSAQALAMELGITDTAKKAKAFDLILALLTLERERCAQIADEYPMRDPAGDGNGYWAAEEIAAAIRRGDSE